MNTIRLSHPNKIIKGTIDLPASKSISNRALILKHVLDSNITLQNLSTADDTVIMQQALQQGNGIMNVKNAGTCMRFLTAYFAAKPNCDVTLLCDERMEKRPIDELVNALKQLGADITYLKEAGLPPLSIKGKQLNGGTIQLSASSSSQFVSALMMISPLCKNDLNIELTGEVTSQPYIDMTVRMMEDFGIDVVKQNSNLEFRSRSFGTIKNPISNFQNQTSQISNRKSQIVIESDWSAASYWYEMVALSKDAEITLPHLSLNSLQGDCVIAEYMKQFGVETIEIDSGIVIKKSALPIAIGTVVRSPQFLEEEQQTANDKRQTLDLTDFPDLAPTLAVTAAVCHTEIELIGLQNLVIKESNRLTAIETELTKSGFDVISSENSLLINLEQQTANCKQQTTNIQTYNDHRMAMAFAPLALVFDDIIIENPEVVEKSYPHFWEDLKRVGFVIHA